jgi:hypothetical protein
MIDPQAQPGAEMASNKHPNYPWVHALYDT